MELLKEDTFMTQVIYIISGVGCWGPERQPKMQTWVKCGILKPDVKLILVYKLNGLQF